MRCLTVRCAEGSATLGGSLTCCEIVAELEVHLWMFDDLSHRRKPDLGGFVSHGILAECEVHLWMFADLSGRRKPNLVFRALWDSDEI